MPAPDLKTGKDKFTYNLTKIMECCKGTNLWPASKSRAQSHCRVNVCEHSCLTIMSKCTLKE